jgi:hypothetical protein
MRAQIILPALCLLAAGCGPGRNDTAADACAKAVADKLEGKTFSLDRADMAAHVKEESADTVQVASTVVFDKGLSTEYQQTFDCRVRLGKTADVISMQFNWNKDDLKRAQ